MLTKFYDQIVEFTGFTSKYVSIGDIHFAKFQSLKFHFCSVQTSKLKF